MPPPCFSHSLLRIAPGGLLALERHTSQAIHNRVMACIISIIVRVICLKSECAQSQCVGGIVGDLMMTR